MDTVPNPSVVYAPLEGTPGNGRRTYRMRPAETHHLQLEDMLFPGIHDGDNGEDDAENDGKTKRERAEVWGARREG